MQNEVLKIDDLQNGVRVITMNRPDARNAFNKELRLALIETLESSERDPNIKVLVMTGEGTAYSAGMDLKEFAQTQSPDAERDNEAGASWKVIQMMGDFPKPLLMAVNGLAVGLGTTMLGYADIAVASENARFKCPFTDMGVGAEASSTWLMPHLLGWQNAAWMLLSSEWIEAEQAKEMGLVHKVVSHDDLLTATVDLASKIAEKDNASAMAIKATMNKWRTEAIHKAHADEGQVFMELLKQRNQ